MELRDASLVPLVHSETTTLSAGMGEIPHALIAKLGHLAIPEQPNARDVRKERTALDLVGQAVSNLGL